MLYRFCRRIMYRCTDYNNFRSAETILKTIYDFRGQGEQGFLQKKVNQSLQKLKNEEKINKQAVNHIINLLKPTEGIILSKQFKQWRFDLALNEQQKFPIHFNSFTSIFMRKLYDFKTKKQQYIYRNKNARCQYIVGPPGIGKSCFFAANKFLHDLKIKYLIKNPDYKNQAIFPDNIKMFYFMPEKTLSEVKESVLEQFSKDFQLTIQEKNKLQIQNQDQFLKNVNKQYQSKGIKVQYVIDQFNDLYKLLDSAKLNDFLNTWYHVTRYESLPTVVLSSKNNIIKAYSQMDPLIRVATSYQNVYKIIIDRQFKDLKSRMLYSFDCLLFDLQKQGLSQQTAYQIISKIQNSFIMTHLSSASIIKKMRDKKQQKNFLSQNNKLQIINEIHKQIKQIKDQQVLLFKNNICQLIQKNKDLEKNNFLKFFLQFMNKYKTQVFDIKYLNKNNLEFLKKISIGYIKQKDIIYKQIIEQKETNLPNFFYYGQVDICQQNNKDRKYQKNMAIYCTIDLSKLYLLKQFFNNKIYLEVIKKCIKGLRPQQIRKWIGLMGGPYFQNKILSIFQNNQKRNLIFLAKNKLIQPIYIDIEVQGTKKLPAIDILMTYDKQFIIEYAKIILNQRNKFYSTGQANFCYDFVVSNLTVTKKLQIFLIDTTIQQKIQSKVNKFQNQLLKLDVFLEILNECAKSESVKQIQLYFCVLNGRKISEVKIFKKYNPHINKIQLKEKLTRVIGFEVCFDKQSFLIKDQSGKDKTQSLKDLSQEILQLKSKDEQIKQ